MSCDQDFASVRAFDDHRVGKHAYTYSQGLRMDPMREDGRRCLSQDEMRDVGMAQDERGRWFLVERREMARKAFHGGALTSDALSGAGT